MCCITSISFDVLVNAFTSNFFHAKKGLPQGCPLSSLLFLLAVEGLSKLIGDAKSREELRGAMVVGYISLSHLLFVDDVLAFSDGSKCDTTTIKNALALFSKVTGMEINIQKSTLSKEGFSRDDILYFQSLIHF